MKRLSAFVLVLISLLCLAGCSNQSSQPIRTIDGNMKTYYEMSDGTWQYDGHTYKYRLEISGRQPSAVKDTTYVYLSNIEDISFHKAMMASGLSSNMNDYFDIEEAVLVEIKTEGQSYFIAKVVELYEKSMLLEVTDKGNCGVNIGNQITVSTEKIAGVLANDASMVTDNYLRIEFDGLILESYPLQLGKVFKIDITNKKGESIE